MRRGMFFWKHILHSIIIYIIYILWPSFGTVPDNGTRYLPKNSLAKLPVKHPLIPHTMDEKIHASLMLVLSCSLSLTNEAVFHSCNLVLCLLPVFVFTDCLPSKPVYIHYVVYQCLINVQMHKFYNNCKQIYVRS